MTLGKEWILEIERGNTRSHCVENWLCKSLWACRKADCGMNIYIYNLLTLTFFGKSSVHFSFPSSAPRVLSVSMVSKPK